MTVLSEVVLVLRLCVAVLSLGFVFVPLLKQRLTLRESRVRERERAAAKKARSEEQLKCLGSMIAFALIVVFFIAFRPRFILS